MLAKANLYRWSNWSIKSSTAVQAKGDAHTVYFSIKLAAGGEITLSYRVRYAW